MIDATPGCQSCEGGTGEGHCQCRLFLNGQIENNRWNEIFTRLIDTNRLTGVYLAGIIGLNFGKQVCINAICNVKVEMDPKSVFDFVE